ncbi:site-specific integrase [Diaphorobacter aerolatus]|uniref:Site-specific integrase n=2 Tax=Diaphorobacter aerolatus TaxID=1288495 RepID=A0A7H0GK07_9BURK|nr:site-specific integrase [Diaphorobacter aerolatus]
MQMEEPIEPEEGTPQSSWTLAIAMLRNVLDGDTYDAVASRHDITRTAVERRIKAVAIHVASTAGIAGLNAEGAAFVRRLRLHRDAIREALDKLGTEPPAHARHVRALTDEEISSGALRIRGRSHHHHEDMALYYILLATGARPLEIARLEVRDYLHADGTVRHISSVRSEVAITGRERPLFFCSMRLEEALNAYLAERVASRQGLGADGEYRGLDPASRLFLSTNGQGFEIKPYGSNGQKRFRCRAIQETYRKLFRYAELKQVTALTVRHTVADRLYARGADESQIGLLLGIADRSAVRDQFPRPLLSLDTLTTDLV